MKGPWNESGLHHKPMVFPIVTSHFVLLFNFRMKLGTREGSSAASAADESLWLNATVCERCAFVNVAYNGAFGVIFP